MTQSRTAVLSVGCVVLACVSAIVCWHRLSGAQQRFDVARSSLLSLQADVTEVDHLRGLRQRAAERKRPEQDMIARVHAALQQAGLPVQIHFQSLRLESDSPLPGASQGYRQQSVAVSLAKLTVEQIGAFLLAWREDQPLWLPTRIELVHARGDDRGRARADADRYDLAVTFSAVYVAGGGST